MSTNLKQIKLTLNETLIVQLQQAAQQQNLNLSEMTSLLLVQQLAARNEGNLLLESIRELRHSLGAKSDSTEIIRRGRVMTRCLFDCSKSKIVI